MTGPSSRHDQEPEFTLSDAERTPCEVWTRVMGYHRPVSAFNAGKRAEHQERRYFCEQPAQPSPLSPAQGRPLSPDQPSPLMSSNPAPITPARSRSLPPLIEVRP